MSFLTAPFVAAYNFLSGRQPNNAIQKDGSANDQATRTSKRTSSAAFEEDRHMVDSADFKRQKKQASRSRGSVRIVSTQGQNESRSSSGSEDGYTANQEYLNSHVAGSKSGTNDRYLMPPPFTPAMKRTKKMSHFKNRLSHDCGESASQATRSTRVAKSEVTEEYDMEEARRRAAATQLPPNSGIWEDGEKDLFFHLSYRGFEPLIAHNWMIDFPTLPISIFANHIDDKSLIQCHRSTDFRAIKALHELLETGKIVRDKKAVNKSARHEPMLEKATQKYLDWAFKDVGLPTKTGSNSDMIPVHAIATMSGGQSVQDVIKQLATKMHILAARHRGAMDIQSSIENDQSTHLTSSGVTDRSNLNRTSLHPELEHESHLPVIYGVMICSSILAIFTLNSHTRLPVFLRSTSPFNRLHSSSSSATSSHTDVNQDIYEMDFTNDVNELEHGKASEAEPDSGLRYIASFDFSDQTSDVWNAFTIAIVCMQIRQQMLETYPTMGLEGVNGSVTKDFSDGLNVGEESWLSNIDGPDLIT